MGHEPDDTRFDDVWSEHRDHLWRIAWLICGNVDMADDVVASAAARCWHNWSKRPITDPAAYLRRAVVNETTDRFRHQGREQRWLERRTGDGRGQSDLAGQVAERTDLLAALDQLPVGQRSVITLRYWADLSVDETAATLRISAGTVKSRTSRALTLLATHLDTTAFRPVPRTEDTDA